MTAYVRHIVTFVAVALLSMVGVGAMAQSYPNTFMLTESDNDNIKTEWGVGVAGLYTGFSKISSDAVTLNSHLGLQGHLDMVVVFGRYFAIESKAIFEKGGIIAEYKGRNYDISTSAFQMPVLLSCRLWDSVVRVNAGIEFGLISNGGYLEGRESYMFGTITPTWNFATGVGVRIMPNILMELRYIHALQDGVNQLGATNNRSGLDFTTRTHKVIFGVSLLL